MNCHSTEKSVSIYNKQCGFTLIELAAAIIISGLLLVPLINAYEQYQRQEKIEETNESVKVSIEMITRYAIDGGTDTVPCPSDRTLARNDPNYGRQFMDCGNAVAPGSLTPYADFRNALAAEGLVNAGDCIASGGVCLADGSGVADLDGDGSPDPVLIGSIPIRDISDAARTRITLEKHSYDAWGGRMTYAISAYLTSSETYAFYGGAVSALDEFGEQTAGFNSNAHFVVVSHGENGSGAYHHESGSLIQPCGPLPPAANSAVENDNCNDDSIFVSAIGYYKGNSDRYYDDHALFAAITDTRIWGSVFDLSQPNPEDQITAHIRNLNRNNVGVGTNTPNERLEVDGTIRTPAGVRVTQICDENGVNCFAVDAYAGNGGVIECPSTGSSAMTGLQPSGDPEGVEARCGTIFSGTVLQTRDCGGRNDNDIADERGWVRGVTQDGQIICTGDI